MNSTFSSNSSDMCGEREKTWLQGLSSTQRGKSKMGENNTGGYLKPTKKGVSLLSASYPSKSGVLG